MNWRFTIIDRNDISTEIEEPSGWDANTCEIRRDLNTHGIVFTTQGDSFEFDGPAMKLLKDEYDAYGAEGIMTLVLEEDCGLGFEEFSRGRFLFNKYEFYCGDSCYVKVPVENANETMNFLNKINQKVDLNALKAFDETTDLPAYNKLGFDLLLPSKTILVKDNSINETDLTEVFNGTVLQPNAFDIIVVGTSGPNGLHYEAVPSTCVFNTGFHHLVPGFTKQIAAEIGNYSFPTTPLDTEVGSGGIGALPFSGFAHQGQCATPLSLDPLKIQEGEIINFAEGTPNYDALNETGNLSFRFKGKIAVRNTQMGNVSFFFLRLADNPANKNNGTADSDYQYIIEESLHCRVSACPDGSWLAPGAELPFDFIYSNPAFELNKGDRLFVFFSIEERKTSEQVQTVLNNNDQHAWELLTDTDSFFKFSNLSKTPPTVSTVYAINEAISRVTESITNDSLRMYSDYFGRTDSEPYAAPSDGCGSLEVITDGIRIRRQENKIEGQTSVFSLSIQDVLDGLNPIHNIGFGLEPDPNRTGYNRIRLESWRFFYNDTLSLSCENIGKISHKCYDKEMYSTFQFGYDKWEAEEYTGLDEFLTKRNCRTTLSSIKNDFSKISKWIGSGFALEVTRRKGNDDSKDWRYDKNIFIICCRRDSGSLSVELGNVINAQNIVDPGTIYNFRISPIRNAMRWMNKILESYRQFNSDAKLIFTDGDGNYFAAGEMESDECRQESGPIAENATIDPTMFADENNAKPFLMPERIAFEFPMSSADYKTLEGNPYGKIYYSNDCEDGYGYIDTVTYKPETGTANFTLIPAVDETISGCVPVAINGSVSMPDATVGVAYRFVKSLYGSQPFALQITDKPSWMSIVVSGSSVFFTGTPDAEVSSAPVAFTVTNCDEDSTADFASDLSAAIPPCDPVSIASTSLPDGNVNTFYQQSIAISGDAPYALSSIVKPSWMTIAISGGNIILSGTPVSNASDVAISFDITNCNGINTVSFSDALDVTTVCIPVTLPDPVNLPDAVVNEPYLFSIPISGTAPFSIANIVKPAWMIVEIIGSIVKLSGTPEEAAGSVEIAFNIGNCSEESAPFAETFNINSSTGEACCDLQSVTDIGSITDKKITVADINISDVTEFETNDDAILAGKKYGDVYNIPTDTFNWKLAVVKGAVLTILTNGSANGSLPSRFNFTGFSNFIMNVDWGDGSPVEIFSGADNYDLTHSYSSLGFYKITFTFNDPILIKQIYSVATGYSYISWKQVASFTGLENLILHQGGNQFLNTFDPDIALPSTLRILQLTSNNLSSFNPSIALPGSLLELNLVDSFGPGHSSFTSPFDPDLPLPSGLKSLDLDAVLNDQALVPAINTLPLSLHSIYLRSNVISVGNVNATLIYLDSLAFTDPGIIYINQYPDAQPTGAGLTAKASLETKGWTVDTTT